MKVAILSSIGSTRYALTNFNMGVRFAPDPGPERPDTAVWLIEEAQQISGIGDGRVITVRSLSDGRYLGMTDSTTTYGGAACCESVLAETAAQFVGRTRSLGSGETAFQLLGWRSKAQSFAFGALWQTSPLPLVWVVPASYPQRLVPPSGFGALLLEAA